MTSGLPGSKRSSAEAQDENVHNDNVERSTTTQKSKREREKHRKRRRRNRRNPHHLREEESTGLAGGLRWGRRDGDGKHRNTNLPRESRLAGRRNNENRKEGAFFKAEPKRNRRSQRHLFSQNGEERIEWEREGNEEEPGRKIDRISQYTGSYSRRGDRGDRFREYDDKSFRDAKNRRSHDDDREDYHRHHSRHHRHHHHRRHYSSSPSDREERRKRRREDSNASNSLRSHRHHRHERSKREREPKSRHHRSSCPNDRITTHSSRKGISDANHRYPKAEKQKGASSFAFSKQEKQQEERDHQDPSLVRRGPPPPPPYIFCHICGQHHWTVQCEHLLSHPLMHPLMSTSGCWKCGLTGHNSRSCPTRAYRCNDCGGVHSTLTCAFDVPSMEWHEFYCPIRDRLFYSNSDESYKTWEAPFLNQQDTLLWYCSKCCLMIPSKYQECLNCHASRPRPRIPPGMETSSTSTAVGEDRKESTDDDTTTTGDFFSSISSSYSVSPSSLSSSVSISRSSTS